MTHKYSNIILYIESICLKFKFPMKSRINLQQTKLDFDCKNIYLGQYLFLIANRRPIMQKYSSKRPPLCPCPASIQFQYSGKYKRLNVAIKLNYDPQFHELFYDFPDFQLKLAKRFVDFQFFCFYFSSLNYLFKIVAYLLFVLCADKYKCNNCCFSSTSDCPYTIYIYVCINVCMCMYL